MNRDAFRLTRDLSFADLSNGNVSHPDAYKKLANCWIFEPAKKMSADYPRDTDHGMALLALELMFFEPLGQFLTGKSSEKISKTTFCNAFDTFLDFLKSKGSIKSDSPCPRSADFYTWARCGLFHSFELRGKLLIDALHYGRCCFSRNPWVLDGWLVDPWLLLPEIESYLESYVNKLNQDSQCTSTLRQNFNTTFKRLFEAPMQTFLASDRSYTSG